MLAGITLVVRGQRPERALAGAPGAAPARTVTGGRVLLGLVAGAVLPVQGAVDARLRSVLEQPVAVALVSFAVAALTVTGQQAVSAAVDARGWFRLPRRAFTARRGTGLALLVAGSLLVQLGWRSAVHSPSTPRRDRRSAHAAASAGAVMIDLQPAPPAAGIRFRVVGPGDRAGAEVAAALSRESRYVRLYPVVPRFTGPTWRVLTGCDPAPAVGLAATTVAPWQITTGVARLCLLGGGAARVAVAVGDRWQGRGIGRALLGALGELAAAAGVRELHAELPVQAHGMARVFRSAFPGARTSWAGPLVRVRCPVPGLTP